MTTKNFLDQLREKNFDFQRPLVIFNVGSRDCQQAWELYEAFPHATIYVFECNILANVAERNPQILLVCREAIKTAGDRITLVPKAVNIMDGNCTFSEDEIAVKCTRLDTFITEHHIPKVDLMWLDLQGSELIALSSMGDSLAKVDFVHTTFSYPGQAELNQFFLDHQFGPTTNPSETSFAGDEVIYENTRIFDIMIPVGPNEVKHINEQVSFTQTNVIGYRKIFLVTPFDDLQVPGCVTINEKIFPFSLATVAAYVGKHSAGRYLQQLLKLYAGLIVPDILPRILVLDADTYFLRPSRFFEHMKPFYTLGNEHHRPHFQHMKRLHPSYRKCFKYFSGTVHHMVFETPYVTAMMRQVEEFHGDHQPFYNLFLHHVSERSHISGASEYEMYLQYMVLHHRARIGVRWLRWKTVDSARFSVLNNNPGQVNYVSWRGDKNNDASSEVTNPEKDKVTIDFCGRHGNNLFQIAAAYAYAQDTGKELVFDIKNKANIPVELASTLNWCDLSPISPWVGYSEAAGQYNPIPELPGNVRLSGYFQSSLYFKKYLSQVVKLCFSDQHTSDTFPPPLQFFPDLPLVSVHIRHTDYVNNAQFDILPEDYYQKGIQAALSFCPAAHFMVFSDNVPYARETLAPILQGHSCVFVDFGSDTQQQLWMSMASCHIISNSTFAWWAAVRRSGWIFTPQIWACTKYEEDVWNGLIASDSFQPNAIVVPYPGS